MVLREDPFRNPNSQVRYPLNLHVQKDFAQTVSMTVQPYAPPVPANFSFTQITVKDLITQIVYTWTNGSWDNQPYVTPGNGMLIMDIFVINLGGTINTGQVTLKDSSGNTLHSQTTPNASIGVIYELGAFSINMPTTAYNLTLSITP
jgi:hypothetical protein